MKRRTLLLLAGTFLAAGSLAADEAEVKTKEDPVHNELRALRDGVLDAFNKKDVDRLVSYVHKDAVVTWQNGEVSRGKEGIREFYRKMMTGDQRVVESVNATAEVDRLTTLFGDNNGLASGSLAEDFKLTDGRQFHLDNRWTAHVVKDDGKWQVAGLHVSANVFNNPILEMAIKKTAWWVGGIALAVGLLLGIVLGRMLGRRRAAQS
jgi:uncharacterized protein (TIGR02246 family)